MTDEIVTAFPLPPDYWRSLETEDDIKSMAPPAIPEGTDLTVFGCLERQDLDVAAIEQSVKVTFQQLRQGHRQVFEATRKIIELAAAGDTEADYSAAKEELETALTDMMRGGNDLRLVQAIHDLNKT